MLTDYCSFYLYSPRRSLLYLPWLTASSLASRCSATPYAYMMSATREGGMEGIMGGITAGVRWVGTSWGYLSKGVMSGVSWVARKGEQPMCEPTAASGP